MKLTDFHFDLPDELIAQRPASNRETSRMLAVDRRSRSFRDDEFVHFPDVLRSDDLLVLNNTKVFPARLLGRSETGANVEIFLIEEVGNRVWKALARPARRLKPGKVVSFGSELSGKVTEHLSDGRVLVEFEAGNEFYETLERVGRTPLPPYIKRDATSRDEDTHRYQTVYASSRGAIAAPTAGLHFTPNVLDRIKQRGVETVEITLHVGYGTFEPVRMDDLSQHSVAGERHEITEGAAAALNSARSSGRRIVAVGTTTTRTLENAISLHGEFRSGSGTAELTITPGYDFKAVGALLTNFHLPESSLLILVSTFAGHEFIMDAYRHAVASRYRFYSYGDCMFIE